MKMALMNLLRRWNELLLLPIAILLWHLIPYLIRMVEPGAGAHDPVAIQGVFLATVFLFFGKPIIWLLLKMGAPKVYKTLDDYLLREKDNLTIWQKGKFSLCYYFGHLFAWVLLVLILT